MAEPRRIILQDVQPVTDFWPHYGSLDAKLFLAVLPNEQLDYLLYVETHTIAALFKLCAYMAPLHDS